MIIGSTVQQALGENGVSTNVGAGVNFCPTIHWTLLECTGEYADEVSLRAHVRAPTVPFGETLFVKEQNYAGKIDRMIFNGKVTFPRRIRGLGSIAMIDGLPHYDAPKKPTDNTLLNIQWIKKQKLSLTSHPIE